MKHWIWIICSLCACSSESQALVAGDAGAPLDGAVLDARSDAGACSMTVDDQFVLADTSGDSPMFLRDGGAPFLWGVATSGHQIEGGNTASDWWAYEQINGHVADGARSDDGPDHWNNVEADAALIREGLGANAYRMSIEWSRIFPTREAFETMTPDKAAVAHYHAELTALRSRGIQTMVTLHHFSSPAWWIDMTASQADRGQMGFASEAGPAEFARWAGWAAAEFGGEVDFWITINEPLVYLLAGYVQSAGPPGLVLAEEPMLRAFYGLVYGHALAYDAIHEADVVDASGKDGVAAAVSVAKHQRVFLAKNPCRPRDVAAASHYQYLMDRMYLNAVVLGDFDGNADGDVDDKEDSAADPALVGRMDFIGLNYYGPSLIDGSIQPLRFLPGYPLQDHLPTEQPKNDLAWDIYPNGFRFVLDEAAGYGLPIYVTENGTADAADVVRPRYLADHLHVLAQAMEAGVDVRGYFAWSLMDNFEWSEGYCPRFGLYRVDYGSKERTRTATEGASLYRKIIEAGRVLAADAADYVYGAPTLCD